MTQEHDKSKSRERAIVSLLIALPVSVVTSVSVAFYAASAAYATGHPPVVAAFLLPFLFVWSRVSEAFDNGTFAFLAACAAQLAASFALIYGLIELLAYCRDRWRMARSNQATQQTDSTDR